MIGIQLDGDTEFLDTNSDTTIQLRLENPLLGDAEKLSPGSFSFPFDLPAGDVSPKNAQKLKNPDVIENNEAYVLQKAKLFFDGVPFRSGNLKSQIGSSKNASSYFTFGLNSINGEIKKANLRDVLNTSIVISDRAINKCIYITLLNPDQIANIIVNGKNYSGSLSNVAFDITSDLYANRGNFGPYAEYLTVGTSPSGVISGKYIKISLRRFNGIFSIPIFDDGEDPLVELSVKVNPSDSEYDYLIEGFDMADYFNDLDSFLSGYLDGTYPTEAIRFPLLFNDGKYDESLTQQTSEINKCGGSGIVRNDTNLMINLLQTIPLWSAANTYNVDGTGDGKYVKHVDGDGNTRYYECWSRFGNINHTPNGYDNYWRPIQLNYNCNNNNSLQPFLRRKWILDKIAETFGFEFDGTFYNHVDVENMLEFNTISLDSPQDFIGNRKYVFWRREFNLNELIPDISVIDYLKFLQSRYNLGFYYNELTGKVSIDFREGIQKSKTFDDITPISSRLNNIEDKRVTGYSITCAADKNDPYSITEVIEIGIPEETISQSIGRLSKFKNVFLTDSFLRVPVVKQKFNSEFTLRTFYYNGISDNGTYTFPSSVIDGTAFTESLNDMVNGIYVQFFKYWLNAKKNWRLIKINVAFQFRSMLKFDWTLKRRYDRSNLIVSAIDMKITNKQVEVSSVEFYTTN